MGQSPTPDIRTRLKSQHALLGPGRVESFLLGAPGQKLGDFDTGRAHWQPAHIEWVVVLSIPISLVGLSWFMLRRRGRRDREGDPQTVVAAFMVSALVLSTVISQFLDVGENYRFRFVSDPILLASMVLLYTRWRDRRRGAEAVVAEDTEGAEPAEPPTDRPADGEPPPEPVGATTAAPAST
jgi:hypothetical protein